MSQKSQPRVSAPTSVQRVELGRAVAQAVALSRAGQWAQAEQVCAMILAAQPAEPTALHVLGVCRLQRGEYAGAEQALAACLRAQPGQAAALANRGIALQALKRFDEALDCYAQALVLAPQQPATLNMQGLALMELKRFDEALASFEHAVEIAPNFAEAWCSRANALTHLRKYDQALASLDRAEALRPDYGEALSNRSIVLNLLGRHEEALAAAQRALHLLPGRAVVHRNLADALAGLARHDEALNHYDRAIELDPQDGETYRGRARSLRALGRLEAAAQDLEHALRLLGDSVDLLADRSRALSEADSAAAALAVADRALVLDPESVNALGARVAALAKLRRWQEALAVYERIIELDPGNPDAPCGRAAVLNELDRFDEALAAFDAVLLRQPDRVSVIADRALALAGLGRYEEAFAGWARAAELDPNLHAADWNEAVHRLLLGQFEIGWRKYESRWMKPEFIKIKQPFKQPRWTGPENVEAKTVFLHAEQGLGDMIQFCRYATILAARGATVILGAQQPLKPLLQTLTGVKRVITNGEALPPFDFHSPLMSLPLAFDTRLETIPANVPYLHADARRVQRWSRILGPHTRFRVGLAWAGDPQLAHDRRRSIRLELLEPMFAVAAEFFCLSKFVRDNDQDDMRRLGIRHYGDELTDFAETAALTRLMDLVISVDTSIAHLAGALAMPVWLLVSNPPEFRWLLDREDSPWYPTARLFRQRERGNWQEVIARVTAELASLVAATHLAATQEAPSASPAG